MQQKRASDIRTWFAAGLLFAAAFVPYANTLRAPFVFDDRGSIVDNPHIRSLWPLSQALGAPPATGASGRPVTAFSLALNYAAGGLDPFGYRLFNVAAHATAAVVLYLLVRRTLRLPAVGAAWNAGAESIALAAAGLWVVHPLASDALNQVVSRNEILCGLFYLLTLYASLCAATSLRPVPWSVAAVVACALGMGSKEVMVSAPLAVLLFDRAFLAGSFARAVRTRPGLYLGLTATWLVLAAAMYSGYGGADDEIDRSVRFDGVRVTPLGYALTHLEILPYYLRLVVWPHPLVMDLGDWPVRSSLADVMPEALVLLFAVAATAVALVRFPRAAVPAAVFFMILAPTSGVLVVADYKPLGGEIAAEHRMWFPLACVLTLVVAGGYRLAARLAGTTGPTIFGAAAAILVVAGAWATIDRNRAWSSESSAWLDTLAKRPNNSRAMLALGSALEREGKPEDALTWYRRAVENCPTLVRGHRNIANLLARARRYAEAEQSLRAAHQVAPRDAEINLMLADLLMLQRKPEDSIPYYEQAIASAPQNLIARAHLGEALALVGRKDEAVALLEDVVQRGPRDPSPYVALGRLQLGRGDAASAARTLEMGTRAQPGNLDLAMLLATAQLEQGDSRLAAATLRSILHRNADHLPAMNGLAWLLATDPDPAMRDPKEAARLAEIVCNRTSYRAVDPIDTLAAACAADGRFKEAEQLAAQALAIADSPAGGATPDLREALRARLEGYRAGRAYVRAPRGVTSAPATSTQSQTRPAPSP